MAALLFTIPGIPLIYAGQEVGETTLRDKIDWSDPNNLRPYYKKLCWIRGNFSSIRGRHITRINTSSSTIYSFYRKNSENTVICGFNFSSGGNTGPIFIPIDSLGVEPDSTYYMNDVLNGGYTRVSGSGLSDFVVNFPGYGAKIWVLADSIITGIEEAPVYVNRLYQNYPNPFIKSTRIRYSIAKKSKVTIKIFDILGRSVRTLESGEMQPGVYDIIWNGRDDKGKRVGKGIYFCRFSNDKFTDVRKIVFLR